MAELKIEPNPRKMRWASILLNPTAHTKELERDGYGQPWAFSFHSAACSGSGLALTACGTGMGANGALQRDEVGLSSLPNSPSSDRRGATIRNASTSISSVEI